MLRNDKCDFVTRSVVNTLNPFRRLCRLFSQRLRCTSRRTLVRHFSRYPFAALLKCFVSFRRLRRHFSTVSPSLLAGYTCSSRWLCQHFSTDLVRHFSPVSPALLKCFVSFRRLRRHFSADFSPPLLGGLGPPLLDGFTVTSRRFHRHFSNALCLFRLICIFGFYSWVYL